MADERLDEQTMALRVAKEFQDGMIVNLGFGIPTLCSNFVPPDVEILFHTENGALGFGSIIQDPEEADIDFINAGVQPISRQAGMSLFEHAESFSMVRGGHIDLAVLGGLQVSEQGDLANWLLPGKAIGSLGGGMDLAFCAKRVIVVMAHTTKDGQLKILKRCSFPLTAPACVDLIVTDVAVMAVTPQGLVLQEMAPGWTAEEVQSLTEPRLILSPQLKPIELL